MSSPHWLFFELPPFFTKQHAPATLSRQSELWCSLILDHATYHAARSSQDVSNVLRFYNTHSDIFYNPAIGKRLSPESAYHMLQSLVALYPNHAVTVVDEGPTNYSVLVAPTIGGLKEMEESLLKFILDNGDAQTTAMLAKKGTVMTFDEMANGNALTCAQAKPKYMARSASSTAGSSSSSSAATAAAGMVPVRDVAAISREQAVRTFLHALHHRPVSVMRPYKITLFNLDGSDAQPYQGVKFGGE